MRENIHPRKSTYEKKWLKNIRYEIRFHWNKCLISVKNQNLDPNISFYVIVFARLKIWKLDLKKTIHQTNFQMFKIEYA